MNLSALCEKLILAGADAIREQGREEVRQQFADMRKREMELDDVALRLTSPKQYHEAQRVSVEFLLQEVLRQALYQKYCATVRDETLGCFALVLTGLSVSEMETLRSLSADYMTTTEERYRHERQERTGRS